MDRSSDWLSQAEYDLRAAESLHSTNNYAWSCFLSQQTAEKALKSLLESINLPSWGHDLIDMIESLVEHIAIPSSIQQCCHRLNLYYISTRYPDAFSSGTPAEKFSEVQSQAAITDAKEVLAFVKQSIT